MNTPDAAENLYDECLSFTNSIFDITKQVRWLTPNHDNVAFRIQKDRMEAFLKAVEICRKEKV